MRNRATKISMITTLALSGKTKMQAFAELRPLVDQQIPPMVFSYNDRLQHKRVALPHSEQLIRLKDAIGRIYSEHGRAESPDFDSPETPAHELIPDGEIEILQPENMDDESQDDEDEEIEEKSPRAKGKMKLRDELLYYLRKLGELREFCNARADVTDEVFDSVSNRPASAGNKLIPAGVPADALLFSITRHWPQDARNEVAIADFDYLSFSRQVMADREIPLGEFHEMFGYCLKLAESRQPIYAYGPTGSGKSYLARQLAEYLEFDYAEVPLTPGATRGDLLGRHTIGGQFEISANENGGFTVSGDGFIAAKFCEIYAGGGVFNFEEMDAADPSMLIVLNNALAADELYNSTDGRRYKKSCNFIAVATANTIGQGATKAYTGRRRLDAATLDRWKPGRVFVDHDPKVEKRMLFKGLEHLLDD